MAKPLYAAALALPATKKAVWNQEVVSAFEKVRIIMAQKTKLFHPKQDAEIIISTDASEVATGATQEQIVQGRSTTSILF